jgi:hypothetical protein
MTDYFAFFDFPRRPLIDEVLLKERFTRLSRSIHPDKSPEAIERAPDGDKDFRHDFAVAVAGFKILSQPESRIAHLLELEFGSRKCDYSGKELSDWFQRIATILPPIDQTLNNIRQETSPFLRAVKISTAQPQIEQLDSICDGLATVETGLLDQIAELDALWPDHHAETKKALAQVAADLTFVHKWLSQVNERRLRFSELLS